MSYNSNIGGTWVMEHEIGRGSFASVFLWKNKVTQEKLVIKKCSHKLNSSKRKRWEDEIQMMKSKRHENIAAGLDVPMEIVRTLNAPEALLGLEYCESDLRKVLSYPRNCCGLQEHTVLTILRDVSHGIRFLHENEIVHRDLKPENILKGRNGTEVVYKITDLGYAKQLDSEGMCETFVGTKQYMAPELYDARRCYKNTADYWSFGTVVFECITGYRPFLLTKVDFKWSELIREKNDDDIWGCEKPEGVVFYSQIPSPNHLCQLLLDSLRDWLQLVLRHNLDSRGGRANSNGEVECYTKINEILDCNIIHVLDVLSCTEVVYSYTSGDSGIHLKYFIQEKLNVDIQDQFLVLAASGVLSDNDSLKKCLIDEVFLFRQRSNMKHTINNNMPEKVQELIGSPEEMHPLTELVESWSHCLYYCMKQASQYRRILRGQRALFIQTKTNSQKLISLKEELTCAMVKLDTVVEFFRQSLESDIQQLSDSGVKSCMDEGESMFTEIKNHSSHINVESVLQKIPDIHTKLCKIKQSPLLTGENVFREIDSLEQHVERTYKQLIDKSHNSEYRDQKSDSLAMYHLVWQYYETSEKLLTQFYAHLKTVMYVRDEIFSATQQLQDKISEAQNIERLAKKRQLYRQASLWKAMKSQSDTPSITVSRCDVTSAMLKELSRVQKCDGNTSNVMSEMENCFSKLNLLININSLKKQRSEEAPLNEVLPPSPVHSLPPSPTDDNLTLWQSRHYAPSYDVCRARADSLPHLKLSPAFRVEKNRLIETRCNSSSPVPPGHYVYRSRTLSSQQHI